MTKNPFKELEQEAKAPEKLKEKVMNSIELSELILSITDLFVVKTGQTLVSLFKTNPPDKPS